MLQYFLELSFGWSHLGISTLNLLMKARSIIFLCELTCYPQQSSSLR